MVEVGYYDFVSMRVKSDVVISSNLLQFFVINKITQ